MERWKTIVCSNRIISFPFNIDILNRMGNCAGQSNKASLNQQKKQNNNAKDSYTENKENFLTVPPQKYNKNGNINRTIEQQQ